MLLKDNPKDDFDDESQDASLDEGDNSTDSDGFSEDEDSPEPESEDIERQKDSDDSARDNRIAAGAGEDTIEEEEGGSPLTMLSQGSALFQSYEQENHAYAHAFTVYYEEKDYQQAIEKFDEAIENASQRAAHDLTEAQVDQIVAKSMYWQAEAYVKTQNIPQAVETFKALIQKYQGHYLALAAQRRTDELNAENS